MDWSNYIRHGTTQDFTKLDWSWSNYPITKEKFKQNIVKGQQDFLVVEDEGKLLGELHIVWNSVDEEEANGSNRAYLCTFRVHPMYRRKGMGGALMESALKLVKKRGFYEVSIGVRKDDEDVKSLYKRWGFVDFIKNKTVDHHNFEAENKYKEQEIPIELYVKKLN
ncbi:ribosomal protein S18 acetylase RimI-like enzyme [Desulfitispora alkaliphila]|uniref:GNAT family N-acetyltransferase n=1 Tax=Desulfitispora alkaliphila TaxID=622674 RepID=UPI003D1E56FC